MVRAAAKNFASVGVVVDPGALRRGRRRAPPRGRPDARDAPRARRPRRSRTPPPTTRRSPDGSRGRTRTTRCPASSGWRSRRSATSATARTRTSAARCTPRSGGRACSAARDVLQGKEMSFNNWLDVDAAYALALGAARRTRAVIVKHNNPCGAALGADARRGVREGVRVRHGLGVRRDRGVPRAVRRGRRRGDGRGVHRGRRRAVVHATMRWRRSPTGRTCGWCEAPLASRRRAGRAADPGGRARAGSRPRHRDAARSGRSCRRASRPSRSGPTCAFAWTVAWRVKSNAIVFAQGRRDGRRRGGADVSRRRGLDRGAQGGRPRGGCGDGERRVLPVPRRDRGGRRRRGHGGGPSRAARCATRTCWPRPRRGAWRS